MNTNLHAMLYTVTAQLSNINNYFDEELLDMFTIKTIKLVSSIF